MLVAAANLFGRQRFHEVRMEDIATAAAVGKGTLYRYFADKEDLYLALLARASEQFQAIVRQALASTTGTRERLVALIAASIRYFQEHPHVGTLIQRAEVSQGDRSPWRPTRALITQLVADVLTEAANRGELTVPDPRRAALMLLGGVRSVVLFSHQPATPELAPDIVAEFLHGYGVSKRNN